MPITNPNTDIPNCVVWLDSSDLTTLFSDQGGTIPILGIDGEFIKCWKDKTSGKLFVNTDTGTSGPVYNTTFDTNPFIQFNGGVNNKDTGFTANFAQSYNSCMVFMVAYSRSTGNDFLYTHAHSTATAFNNTDLWVPLRQVGSTIRNVYATASQQSLSWPVSTLHVLNSYLDNDETNGFGVGIGLNGIYNLPSTPITIILPESKPMVVHSIGRNSVATATSNDNNFSGYISEVLTYNRMLNPEEIQQVENYLAQKWLGRNIGSTCPKSSGDWYNPNTWLDNTIPESHQRVYCGDKKITINGDIEVERISNASFRPKIYNANGKFIVSGNFNIKGTIQNTTEHFTENCLEISTSSGVVNLSGNILNITNSTNQTVSYKRFGACVLHEGNCDLNVYGSVGAGQNAHYGIYHDSSGVLTVYGNINPANNSSAGIYLPAKNNIGKVVIYGNVTGSGSNGIQNISTNAPIEIYGDITTTGSLYGLTTSSAGIHLIHGNVYASSSNRDGRGISMTKRSIVHVFGNVYADNSNSTNSTEVGSIAIYNDSSLAQLYIYGNIYNKGYYSTSPLKSRYDLSQAIVSRKVFIVNPASQIFYRKTSFTPSLSFYGVGNYDLSLLPSLSDVILGEPFGQGNFNYEGTVMPSLYGSMSIPPREVVRAQETTGNRKGIAVFERDDLQYVWDCDFTDVAINNNVIGDYLVNLMTVEQMGKIISDNNL